jgi:NAD(P)-dependent dehydrogenase (short-subunit alcohol dehydrogenase family)
MTFASFPSLRDRVVLVTGGASGIGAEEVLQFVQQGSKVAFVDTDVDGSDLRDVAALQAAVAKVADSLGPISVLVNNAASDERHDWRDVTVEYWDERMATNLRHQFFSIQAVAPMMQAAGGGSIINFGSISWHTNQGTMPAYTTAKAGVEGLTKGMARDLGGFGIRVNCIVPGWVMTARQIERWLTPEAETDLLRTQCLKSKVMPADVARLALWLASDDSKMCSAQLWVVDGGRL